MYVRTYVCTCMCFRQVLILNCILSLWAVIRDSLKALLYKHMYVRACIYNIMLTFMWCVVGSQSLFTILSACVCLYMRTHKHKFVCVHSHTLTYVQSWGSCMHSTWISYTCTLVQLMYTSQKPVPTVITHAPSNNGNIVNLHVHVHVRILIAHFRKFSSSWNFRTRASVRKLQ